MHSFHLADQESDRSGSTRQTVSTRHTVDTTFMAEIWRGRKSIVSTRYFMDTTLFAFFLFVPTDVGVEQGDRNLAAVRDRIRLSYGPLFAVGSKEQTPCLPEVGRT